jgi:hypothetical protein
MNCRPIPGMMRAGRVDHDLSESDAARSLSRAVSSST